MSAIALDTNLLVLFVVRSASSRLVLSHKRTKAYTSEDFDRLSRIVAAASSLVVTPHVLSETSNLVRQFAEPGRRLIGTVLQRLIANSTEIYVESRTAASRIEYHHLGLTDATVIEAQADDIVLLTDDLDLYVASLTAGRTALDFSHLRDQRLGS